jgi:predicted dehydrogenase
VNTRADQTRVAVVGCGAAARLLHVPALARRDDCALVALVDPARDRAAQLARRHRVPHVLSDHRALADIGATAAIVAAPNDLHAPLTLDLVGMGLDVLVEKPVAVTVKQADAMVDAANSAAALVAVGMFLRFAAGNRAVKSMLDARLIGEVSSFQVRWGVDYAWPVSTGYLLDRQRAGGGTLIDVGPHVIDLIRWWLGEVAAFEYWDDSYGGVEADCLLELTLETGVSGSVELSRTRDLGYVATIQGERGALEVDMVGGAVTLRLPDGTAVEGAGVTAAGGVDGDLLGFTQAEHDDFLQAVRHRRPPAVTVADGRATLALIEACYGERRLLELPWVASPGAVP